MNNTEGLLDRARLLLDQHRVNDAIQQLKEVLQQDPENDEALAVYARCHFDKNNIAEGKKLLEEAIRIDPNNSYYFYLLGFAAYRSDNHIEAIDQIYRAMKLNPYVAEYYGLLAFVYLEEKKFETALTRANEGLAIDSENITCLNARATAQNKLSRTDEAIATMENALASDPENEFTHATVGWNYLEKGKHKLATKHFRESLRIAPDQHSAKVGLKEALKSKIPPYRWLLQLNFWLRNKGSKFRWIFIIGLLVGVRVIRSIGNANPGFENIATIAIGAYIVFIGTSWIINPLANIFLLFHPDGKHALEKSEKWNAIGFLICMFSGIALLAISAAMPPEQSGTIVNSGILVMSLGVPVGHMKFPITLKGNSFSQWLSIAMIVTGLIAVIVAFTGAMAPEILFVVYFILFVIYSWTGSN